MFSLVVKIAVAVLIGEGGSQADRLSQRERMVWNQLRPSIVTLVTDGKPTGVAALIDDSGYFVTHIGNVDAKNTIGKSMGGKELSFTVISKDPATELELIKTNDWPSGSARPFRSPMPDVPQPAGLLGVLPTGPIRAVVVQQKPGVFNQSHRLVTLSEIRFESSPQMVGGALLFNENGDLVGTLNATLRQQNAGQQGFPNTLNNNAQNNNNGLNGGPNAFGPGEMTVAYTVGADTLQHTLQCFLAGDHQVQYAYLGIFCIDAPGGGALVEKVTKGSPADKSGIQAGDILKNISLIPIQDQMDFARQMLRLQVGQMIHAYIKRGSKALIVDVTTGKADN